MADDKPVIDWKGDVDRDLTAKVGDYILRAEDKGRNVWSAVYYKMEEVASSIDSPNMRGGRQKAISAMKRHQKQMV